MDKTARLLFTGIAVVFVGLGLLAILTEYHSGHTKRGGKVTLVGDDAVWMGQTMVMLGLMPLVVWLPKSWAGKALVAWGGSFAAWMAWWLLRA